MFETEVAFRNRHYAHSRFSRALAQCLSISILLLTVALTTASFAQSNCEGPAELARMTVLSAMVDTPAPGSIFAVNAGGDLQSALDNARCGDVIELQAGATFTGPFLVPAKNCDIKHWIIIRTSSPDSALPAEGQRATPCYAGVASRGGPPKKSRPNPQPGMGKVKMQTGGDGPPKPPPGGNFSPFLGLE